MRSHPEAKKEKGSSSRSRRKRRSVRKKRRSDSEREDESKDGDEESSKPSDEDRPPIRFYGGEPTRWTIADTETDPIYIRDSDSSSFVPLPRAEADSRPSPDPRIEEHFVGVRTSDEAASITKPDDFVLYYRREDEGELDIAIPLYLAHRNTRNKIFHFPIIRSTEENGAQWWQVQITSNMAHSVRMPQFRQLSDLVRCYHLYRFTDARTGRMEVFPLWKGGILDDYK